MNRSFEFKLRVDVKDMDDLWILHPFVAVDFSDAEFTFGIGKWAFDIRFSRL